MRANDLPMELAQFFYDSDEDSDDVFFRSAYSRSPRKVPGALGALGCLF